ncbi:hypothetical protein ACFV2N_34170 [Streptomyces sp. NPDC059680]|uniref:hypothetical protein n=1 Tax=Streptomyces TaxID=1883 RepID=UPI001E37DCE6|nr:hypothetical protein [Streptomyces barringtoniae]MCC5478609.1 hypothetical protein [Streptomyces barringtoniae]
MLPDGGGSDLRRGLEALQTFKSRVDALLDTFERSPGDPKKVGMHTLSLTSFCGTGQFAEATDLHSHYQTVHEQITSLSQTLKLQIEAMQIAVHGADIGYDKLEDDLRRRFHEIRTQVNEQIDEQDAKTQAGTQQKRTDQHQSKAGY